MATKIVTKNSSTASAVPTASDLVQGELAVNVADKRLFTEDNGGAIVELGTNPSGDVTFQDNGKAIFGAGSDLQIYHDGSNSYISEGGDGELLLRTNGAGIRLQKNNGENMLKALTDGAVQLYYDNQDKLATTSTGIDVTGTATMDGLTVDGASDLNGNVTIGSSITTLLTGNDIDFQRAGDSYLSQTGGGALNIRTNDGVSNKVRMNLASNGDISFYEDTGTTPKFFWDASAETLGIGTSSPDRLLTLQGDNSYMWMKDAGGGNVAFIGGDGSNDGFLRLYNGSHTAKVEIQSDGDTYFNGGSVGIGTTANYSNRLYIQSDATGSLPTNQLIQQNDSNVITVKNGNNSATYSGIKLETRTTGASGWLIANEWKSTYLGDLVFKVRDAGTSSAERMRIDSSGNLLVGRTASTSAKLHLENATDVHMDMNSVGDNRGKIGSKTNDLYIGHSSSAANIIFKRNIGSDDHPADSGNETMRIDSSGNLLVGTTDTTPGIGDTNAGISMSASNGIIISRANDAPINISRNSSDGALTYFRKDGAIVGSIGTTGGDIYIGTGDANVRFDDGADQIYPVNSDGSHRDGAVGLGWSGGRFKDLYLSSKVKLQASGGNQHSVGVDANDLVIRSETAGSETARFTYGGNLLVGQTSNAETGTGIGLVPDGTSHMYSASTDALMLGRGGSDGDILSFNKSGTTVGSIGVEGGANLLIGNGDTGIRFAAANNAIHPWNTTTLGLRDAAIDLGADSIRFKDLYLSGSVNANYINSGSDTNTYINFAGSDIIRFGNGNSESARLDASGNLLVGTTAVDPAGNNTAGMSVGTGGGLSVQGTNTALVIGVPSAQTYGMAFRYQGVLAGRIGIEANNITVADVSDYRLKENVAPLSDALTRIKALKPSSFNFINYPDKTHEGFIAHELQEVIPYAVSGEKDALITEATKDRGTVGEIDPQAVDLRKLVPTLVAAIQEQQTLIESLTARIAALEE